MIHKNNFQLYFYIVSLISILLLVTYYGFQRYFPEPVLIDTDTIETLINKQQEIDYKYCKGPCKFINFLHLPEQETRSQLHLRHMSFAAGLVNRTVILPNVGSSRIGGCKEHDFSFYYDMDWATNNRHYFHSITMKEYRAWLQERQDIGIPATSNVFLMKMEDAEAEHYLQQKETCFDDFTKPALSYVPTLDWKYNEKYLVVGQDKVVNFLRGRKVMEYRQNKTYTAYEYDNIEVIDLYYPRGHRFMTIEAANDPIPYSKELVALSEKARRDMEPYVAVHWRMETISNKTDRLFDCAKELVSTLNGNFSDMNVFLLTDYPHTFTKEQQESAINERYQPGNIPSWIHSPSDTFFPLNIKSVHHRAIQYLYTHKNVTLFESTTDEDEHIVPPTNWNLIHIPKELGVSDRNNLIDSGWSGILDKITAMEAKAFLAGAQQICARKSTFTAQIIEQRQEEHLDAIYYFGTELKDRKYPVIDL